MKSELDNINNMKELDINELIDIDGGGAITTAIAQWLFGELGGEAGAEIGGGSGIGGIVGGMAGAAIGMKLGGYLC